MKHHAEKINSVSDGGTIFFVLFLCLIALMVVKTIESRKL